jgi:uncharacterized protein (TIGR02266 family)
MTTILLGKECSPFLEIDDSLLQRSAVRLVWAETVDAFLPLAREHRPDLVVLDPQVPGFDAFETARALTAEHGLEKTLVFVIGNTFDQARAQAAGVAGLFNRPVTQARLLEAIRRHRLATERDDERVEVAIKVAFSRDGSEGVAFTRDVSLDGCFLLTHERFGAGDRLQLVFQIPVPGGREVRVAAEVMRVEPVAPGEAGTAGIAVRFVALAPADRVELGRFLRERGRGAP